MKTGDGYFSATSRAEWIYLFIFLVAISFSKRYNIVYLLARPSHVLYSKHVIVSDNFIHTPQGTFELCLTNAARV